MKRKSLIPALIMSLFLTSAPAIAQNAASIFQDLMRENYSLWRGEREKEILLENALLQAKQQSEKDSLGVQIEAARARIIADLRQLMTSGVSLESRGEASYKLAVLLSQRIQDASEAKKLSALAAEQLRSSKASRELKVKSCMLAGELSLLHKATAEARTWFECALGLLEKSTDPMNEMQAFAQMGMGDAWFADFMYSHAEKSYRVALEGFDSAARVVSATRAGWLPALYVRLAWSAFKQGLSRDSLEWALSFARSAPSGPGYPVMLYREMERVAGVSLYEKDEKEDFRRIAGDAELGETGKKFILAAFGEFEKAGRCASVEPLAQLVEKDFKKSATFLEFAEVRKRCAAKTGQSSLYYNILALTAEHAHARGLWRQAITLNKVQDAARSRKVAEDSEAAAAFYFNEGVRTRARGAFQRSSFLYEIRLAEVVEGENRASLLIKGAESYHAAGDYPRAWQLVQESLRYPLTENVKKGAWHLHVKISRELFLSHPNNGNLLSNYRNAVSNFFAAFSWDDAARASVIELGETLDRRKLRLDAVFEFEKLLIGASERNSNVLEHYASVASVRIAEIVSSLESEEESFLKLAALERFISEKKLEVEKRKRIQAIHAGSARRYFVSLRERGKLKEASRVMTEWLEEFSQNPEHPWLFLDTLRFQVGILDWQQALHLSNTFLGRLPSHAVYSESAYWSAKACEQLLQFSRASHLYEQAFNASEDGLDIDLRIDALYHASSIQQQLGDKTSVARLKKKSAVIYAEENLVNEALMAVLDGVRVLREINRHEQALEFVQAYKKTALKHSPDMAHIFNIEEHATGLKIGTKVRKSKELLKVEIHHIALAKNLDESEKSTLLAAGYKYLLEDTLDEILSLTAVEFGKLQVANVDRTRKLLEEEKQRGIRILPLIKKKEGAELHFLHARIAERSAQLFTEAMDVATNVTESKKNEFAGQAEFARGYAHQQLFEATRLSESNPELLLQASKRLDKYTQVRTGMEPEISPLGPENHKRSVSAQLLEALNHGGQSK